MDYAAAIAWSSALVIVLAVGCLIVGEIIWDATESRRVERNARRLQIIGGSVFGLIALVGFFAAIWLGFAQTAAAGAV